MYALIDSDSLSEKHKGAGQVFCAFLSRGKTKHLLRPNYCTASQQRAQSNFNPINEARTGHFCIPLHPARDSHPNPLVM